MTAKQLLSLEATQAAPALLGWTLRSRLGGVETGGIIIETEAYHGATDPASHAFRGQTLRTTPMFEAGGTLYVNLSYGLHYCLNLVTGPAGEAQAVLIRALWPTIGTEAMATRRHGAPSARLTNGPANLTQALGIDLSLTGHRLGPEQLTLLPPNRPVPVQAIKNGPRIGISQGKDLLWRFWTSPDQL